jgi:hypothetical protein
MVMLSMRNSKHSFKKPKFRIFSLIYDEITVCSELVEESNGNNVQVMNSICSLVWPRFSARQHSLI